MTLIGTLSCMQIMYFEVIHPPLTFFIPCPQSPWTRYNQFILNLPVQYCPSNLLRGTNTCSVFPNLEASCTSDHHSIGDRGHRVPTVTVLVLKGQALFLCPTEAHGVDTDQDVLLLLPRDSSPRACVS